MATAALRAGAAGLLVDDGGAAELAGTLDPAQMVLSGEPTAPRGRVRPDRGIHARCSRLRGAVLSLKRLRQGEGVSYGYTHRAPARHAVVALVTGGYAQGVVRALGNAASVVIAGERHPIVGRVAMDVCVVDVGRQRRAAAASRSSSSATPRAASRALAEWTDATG